MFGIMVATVLGILGYIFKNKNFYECYLFSTTFLFWWTIGAGLSASLLRRFIPEITARISGILRLSQMSRRIIFRQEILFCLFAVFSIGAAYLLNSSLDGLEGLRYWNSSRLVAGMSMYCLIVFMNYVDFRKNGSR